MQTILTRRFDELEIASDGFDENVDYSEFEEKMSVPKIKAAVQEILTMAAEISDTDYKLDALCSTIEGKQLMQNNKVMVFSSFRHTLQYLYENLTKRGIRAGIVHGGVKDEDRVILRERFMMDKNNKESLDVLLFSEVGCEGLDYQFCDCMINYDLPWNPQAIEQRIGRIDRNGQKAKAFQSSISLRKELSTATSMTDACRVSVFLIPLLVTVNKFWEILQRKSMILLKSIFLTRKNDVSNYSNYKTIRCVLFKNNKNRRRKALVFQSGFE